MNIPNNVQIPGKLFMKIYEYFFGIELSDDDMDYITTTLDDKANKIQRHCEYSAKHSFLPKS